MDHADPASSPAAWYTKKRYLIPLVVAVVLLVAWLVLSLTLLNEEWLKARLVEYVRESFDAEMQVETLSFSAWKGEAQLTGIVLSREQPLSKLDVAVDSAELKMRVLPLLWRKVDVTRVVLTGPNMTYERQQVPEAEPQSTLDRLTRIVAIKLLEALSRLITEFLEMLDEGLGATPEWEISVARLTIHDGRFDYRALRGEGEPFEASAKNVEYSINDLDLSPRRVAYSSPLQFLNAADLRCDLDLGGIPATVEQSLSAEPYTVSLRGVDLGRADRHLNQKDALVIREGLLDFNYVDAGEACEVEAELKGLKLERNPETDIDEVLFIPADRLISHVDQTGGNLTLRFQVDRGEIRTSEDLRFLMIEMWKEMWIQVLAKYKDEGLRQLKDRFEAGDFEQLKKEGAEMLRGFLRGSREKEEDKEQQP